nr:hypothetical protein [uncultured Mediterranean phage uvMED]BAR27786.1 hypothetical protein [uncultured Mediterranean phage uvMED]BAR39534.1 hypothetical protein [uncultured Mediterranean phage uvMED]|tara:strand:- start:52971 stop:53171 length:201 start_codon:yes stop_codon:yes gene_type:complete
MNKFAVQPADWANFDPHGCDYATNMNSAYRLASELGADAIIWKLGTKQAMKWVRVTADEVVHPVTN